MTHSCAATDCIIQVDDVHVLCGHHADQAGRSLHLALMAAQIMSCAADEERAAGGRAIYDKRLTEAQEIISSLEIRV